MRGGLAKKDVGVGYETTLREIKERVSRERLRVVLSANSAMVLLYWDIGEVILRRQASEGWGAKVIDRLSADLSRSFPDMKGFSPRNLKYMRKFAEAWRDRSIVQQLAAQLPWFHHCVLLDRVSDPRAREWYVRGTIQHGWSRALLSLQIEKQAHRRAGRAITNFRATLPPGDSDLAEQAFKDPYLFDFLGTADLRRERDVENALIEHVQKFLLELGAGFAFVGRQVRLSVGDSEFFVDLLFYHLKLRCFVVVELKAVPFDPAFIGQLGFYLSAIDAQQRHPTDKPTIGLLLCKSKDKLVVEYALRDLKRPIGVAEWETQVVSRLPKELEGALPTLEQLEAATASGEAKGPAPPAA